MLWLGLNSRRQKAARIAVNLLRHVCPRRLLRRFRARDGAAAGTLAMSCSGRVALRRAYWTGGRAVPMKRVVVRLMNGRYAV
ncbi:hypothetical protein KCP70_02760 [Salmonella enterica subsp. enterica]|nr:hypothetical protein KCP70_02760 [Salmonella enterica subsp. enterica]